MVFWDVVGLWGYLRSICQVAPRVPASHVIVAGERGPAVWVWDIPGYAVVDIIWDNLG